MGANSQFHKVIGAVEIVVGGILDAFGQEWIGTPLILTGIQTFLGVPGMPRPMASASRYMVSSAIAPMPLLYGETKLSGVLLVGDSGDGSGSTDIEYKYLAIAHSLSLKTGSSSALPLYGIQSHSGATLVDQEFAPLAETGYWFDNINIPMAVIDGSGNVTGSGYAGGQPVCSYAGLVQIVTHLGEQTVVDPLLAAGLSYWDTNAIGHGVCYTVVRIHMDPNSDQTQTAFPNGMPQTVNALLSGQKIYDPRLDSTSGGSGAHRKATPTTWEYAHALGTSPQTYNLIGTNPALILRDYLVRPTAEGGCGVDPARIPDDYLATAASICEEILVVPNGSGGTQNMQKYRCCIALNTGDDCSTNVQKILDSMCGWMIQTAGELRIFAGKYVAPTTTITDSWLAGPLTFQTTAELDSRWNTIDATFTDPASGYIEVQTQPFTPTGALAQDGGIVKPRKLSLPAVNNQYRAQYICHVSGNQSRNMKVVTAPLNVQGVDLDEGEVATLQLTEYGLNEPFMVLNWQRKSDSSVVATLISQPSTTFNPQTFVETRGQGAPPWKDSVPPQVTGLSGTDATPGARLNWNDLPQWNFSTYEVWRSTSSGGTYTRVAKGLKSSAWTDPITTTATYYYKVRGMSYMGIAGAFSTVVGVTSHAVGDYVGGTGANLEPSRYAIVSAKIPTYAVQTSLSIGRSASEKAYGYLMLQLTSTSGSVAQKLALVGDITKPNMTLTNKLFGIQVFLDNIDSDANGHNFNFCLKNSGGANACTPVAATALGSSGKLFGAVLDMTAAADLNVYLQMEWNGAIANTKRVNVQGWGVFQMPSTTADHPAFVAGAAESQDDLGDGLTLGAVNQTGMTNNAVDLSLAAGDAGTGVEGVVNANTTNLVDGAGLSQNADMANVTNVPATVDAAAALSMMTDVQKSVGVATAVRQALFSDGAAPYWADPFGGTVDGAGDQFSSGAITVTGSMANIGNKWVIPNIFGGNSITVIAWLSASFSVSGGTGDTAVAQIQISLDGGSTWTTSTAQCGVTLSATGTTFPAGSISMSVNGVPTGSVQIRVQAQQTAGVDTVKLQSSRCSLTYSILNSSNGVLAASVNLSASIPATAAMSCGTTYPVTSCTATKNITVSPIGGIPDYTYSNAKTAGTGTITAGSTAKTFTVQDTETTTTAGATHTTTVQSSVTDSQTYTATAGSESGTTATISAFTPGGLIPVGATFRVSGSTPSGYNKTTATALSGTNSTTIKYTANSSGLGALTAATIDQVTVTTSTCVVTGTFTLSYSAVSVSISMTGGGCKAFTETGATSCTGQVNFTTNASGGDGAYTYANSKTSGSGTITAGSTSKTWAAQYGATVPFSVTGVYKSIVTDGHSNTANKSVTATFTGSAI